MNTNEEPFASSEWFTRQREIIKSSGGSVTGDIEGVATRPQGISNDTLNALKILTTVSDNSQPSTERISKTLNRMITNISRLQEPNDSYCQDIEKVASDTDLDDRERHQKHEELMGNAVDKLKTDIAQLEYVCEEGTRQLKAKATPFDDSSDIKLSNAWAALQLLGPIPKTGLVELAMKAARSGDIGRLRLFDENFEALYNGPNGAPPSDYAGIMATQEAREALDAAIDNLRTPQKRIAHKQYKALDEFYNDVKEDISISKIITQTAPSSTLFKLRPRTNSENAFISSRIKTKQLKAQMDLLKDKGYKV